MNSRFALEADARELRALIGIARRLAAKLARGTVVEIWTVVLDRLRAGSMEPAFGGSRRLGPLLSESRDLWPISSSRRRQKTALEI